MLSGLARSKGATGVFDLRYVRAFSARSGILGKSLPPRLIVPESDIEESFLKGSGPGGQKINKTSSAVQLKHLPTGIVVKNQETRSREQNRRNARRLLGEKLEEMEKGPLSRTVINAGIASKKKASAAKKARRKYRRLEDEKAASVGGANVCDDEEEDEADDGNGIVEGKRENTDGSRDGSRSGSRDGSRSGSRDGSGG